MNVLGLFHTLSPETVQKMDSDLSEAKAACERQHDDLETAKTRLTESITYGCELQRRVSDATLAGTNLRKLLTAAEAELESVRILLAAENSFRVRREATLKGQITKLKKRLG